MAKSARFGVRGLDPRWFLALLAAGCGSVATDGSGPGRGSLAVVPEYPEEFVIGALNLVIDRVRVRVVRHPSEWIVDTSAAFPADAQSVTMRVSMPLKTHQERLGVVLELWAGPLLIFAGARDIDVTEGPPSGLPPRIRLTYRGPGAEARTIRITPRDTVLRPGDQLGFGVVADNGEGIPVGDVYVNWSLGDGAAAVTPAGVLKAPAHRGSALLHAIAATGARDSTRIWFAPPPTEVLPVAGAQQIAVAGAPLSGPLVAKVLAADGIGVPGIPVRFSSTAPGATVATASVITDAEGIARTAATAGTEVGLQRFVAEVAGAGIGAAEFTVTALVGGAAQIVIVGGNNQVAAPGAEVGLPLVVEVQDQHGNPVSGADVRWSVVKGGGILGAVDVRSGPDGRATAVYRMGPTTEFNVVSATLDLTGTAVLFVLQNP